MMNMCDIKYYPLVDCDTDGTDKIAMFVSTDKEMIESVHSMYLAEVVPHFYRLYCNDTKRKVKNESIVRCPKCGSAMLQVGSPLNKKKLGVYTCKKCL